MKIKNLFFKVISKIIQITDDFDHKQNLNKLQFKGENIKVDHRVHIINPEMVAIGSNTSISSYTTIFGTHGVTIGENCWISSSVGISSYNHIMNSSNRHRDKYLDYKYCKPVVIGDNVWIAMNVTILPGCVVGNNSIIGAGSVVNKNIPPNEIWVGNPARFIKRIDLIS